MVVDLATGNLQSKLSVFELQNAKTNEIICVQNFDLSIIGEKLNKDNTMNEVLVLRSQKGVLHPNIELILNIKASITKPSLVERRPSPIKDRNFQMQIIDLTRQVLDQNNSLKRKDEQIEYQDKLIKVLEEKLHNSKL